jgi:Putative beta-barrel porin-2, OmpL-like. bbp2
LPNLTAWWKCVSASAGHVVFVTVTAVLAATSLTPRAAAQAATESPVGLGSVESGSPLLSLGNEPGRQLIINGFGVLNYDYNFNNDQNSFTDSAFALSLFKGISDNLAVFAQVTTSRNGPSPFLADAGASRDIATDIDNLQLTWRPAPASGLEVTAGKFDSPLAIERDDAPLNFQATSSFTFSFARPVKFTGLAIHDAVSPHFEVWGLVANGWDQDVDNNRGKTGGVYFMFSSSLAAHFGIGALYGPEKDNRETDNRAAVVATVLLQPTQTWVVGAESVYGEEPHSAADGGQAKWYGEMLFSHYRFGPHWAATLRLDYLDDAGGSRTGTPQVLRSYTLSPQYLIGGGFFGIFRYLDRTSLRLPEIAVRLDLRYDQSTAATFASRQDGVGKRDHAQATLQTVFLF